MKGRRVLGKLEEHQGGQRGWNRVSERTAGHGVRGATVQMVWASRATVRTLAFPLGEVGALAGF